MQNLKLLILKIGATTVSPYEIFESLTFMQNLKLLTLKIGATTILTCAIFLRTCAKMWCE